MRSKQSYIDCGKLGAKRRWEKEPSKKIRFWKNVKKLGPDDCWPWMLGLSNKGYGKTKLNGKYVGSHRVAWILTKGEIPKGLCVCHHCDNPPCCNPKHLFLGTHSENALDALRKGRIDRVKARATALMSSAKGEKHHAAKFTNALARKIRLAVENGRKKASLAREFNVATTTIGRLVNGQTWKHVNYLPSAGVKKPSP